ncbi:hypothetical protein L0938_01965 [Paracidovorax citrulli]
MPTSAADHRHAAGRFHARSPATAPPVRPLDTTTIRRVETPAQALAAVLSISNATGFQPTTARPPATRAVSSLPANCIPVPVSQGMPGVLHGVAGLLRSPVTELFTDARNAWERHQGLRCAPPLGAGMRMLLQVGDAVSTLAEAAAVGSRGVFAMQEVASVLDLGADAMEHRPLDPDTVMQAVFGQAGLRLEAPGTGTGARNEHIDMSVGAPHPAIAQATAELRGGRVRVRFEDADHALSISDGRFQVRTDAGDVPVRWDTVTGRWARLAAEATPRTSRARADSSIRLFDHLAEQVHLQTPLDAVRLRLDLLGPDGILYYDDPATGAAGNAVCVDGRYYPATLEPGRDPGLGLRIGTLALEQRDGIYQLRGQEEAGAEPVGATRCRRSPGPACVPGQPQFSVGLSRILRQHHARALTADQARSRGIVADPARPGWHLSRNGGRLRHYVQFSGRYFRVRMRQLDAFTQRLSVYLPRASGAGRLSQWGRLAHRIADIRQSLPAHEHRFMTQAEFNVEYRGMPSLEAAQVYESAVQQNGGLRLSQLQRAAIRTYLLRRRSVDEFLQSGGVLPPVFTDAPRMVARINRGLARIPSHAGRVYTALAVDAHQLAALEVGQTLYSDSFLVASGDRGRAVGAVARAGDGPQGASTLLTLDMRHHAHPTGLISLQDEAQVLIGNNVLFKVIATSPGELHLEELNPTRQAMGPLGAQSLRSVPLRGV